MFFLPEGVSGVFRFAVCISLALLLLTCAGCSRSFHDSLRAVEGQFDLRGVALSEGKTIALDGQWEFYWDQLLTPDDFLPGGGQPHPSGFFNLPGSWPGHRLGDQILGPTGQATFRLRLLPGKMPGHLTLRLFDIHEAYKLWANGHLVAQSGQPGRSVKGEVPARSLVLAEIPLQGRPVDLLLQVSNHHFRIGGVTESILAAHPGPLERAQARDWGLALFLAGSLLIMAVYHLVLYYWRKKDPAPLYFGLYCLFVVGHVVTSNSSCWVVSLILPHWDPLSREIFSLSCFVVWASLIFRFLKTLFPEEFHQVLLYFLDARIAIFLVLLLFAPLRTVYWFIALCLVQTFVYSVYYLHRLIVCVRRGRTGAGLLLAGITVQFLAGVNDPLVHLGVIDSIYLVEPAVFLFVLSQSLVLSRRFSAAFSEVEELSVQLEQKNASLQEEMEERNRLEQKIVDISEEERRELSYELHDSLCQQLTGARLRADALVHGHAQDADAQELGELADILKNSTKEAYKIARGLWPVEHGASGPSLENLVKSISETTGIRISMDKQLFCKKCASPNLTPLYRIAQEALGNAAKHSKAQHIEVRLDCCGDGRIVLIVRDDGIGRQSVPSEEGGLGSSIMAHRAQIMGAELRVEFPAQGGTKLICTAPCDAVEALDTSNEQT